MNNTTNKSTNVRSFSQDLKSLQITRDNLQKDLESRKRQLVKNADTYAIDCITHIYKDTLPTKDYDHIMGIINQTITDDGRYFLRDWTNNAERLLKPLLQLPKPQRLIVADYLTKNKIIRGGCAYELGRYKRPSECGSCVDANETINYLQLHEYLHFIGERRYGLSPSVLQSVYQSLVPEDNRGVLVNIEKMIDNNQTLKNLDQQIDKLTQKQNMYDILSAKTCDPEVIATTEPMYLEYIRQAMHQDKVHIRSLVFDKETRTLALLLGYRSYSGSGGCEYGVILKIYRGENVSSQRIVYRDAYYQSKDDRSLDFDTITKLEVVGDTVNTTLKSHKKAKTYTTNITYKQKQLPQYKSEDIAKLLTTYPQLKEQILQSYHKDTAYMTHNTPWVSMPRRGMEDIQYFKPQVIDELIDEISGNIYVVIKAQIDGIPSRGVQYQRVKYHITPHQSKVIDVQTARESELKEGKQITMRANE